MDPLHKTREEQLEEELQKQNEEFGDVDPDAKSSEVIELDEVHTTRPEETVIVNNDLNTTIITTDDE